MNWIIIAENQVDFVNIMNDSVKRRIQVSRHASYLLRLNIGKECLFIVMICEIV